MFSTKNGKCSNQQTLVGCTLDSDCSGQDSLCLPEIAKVVEQGTPKYCPTQNLRTRTTQKAYEIVIRIIPKTFQRNLVSAFNSLLHAMNIRRLSSLLENVEITYWDVDDDGNSKTILLKQIKEEKSAIRIVFFVNSWEISTEISDLRVKFNWNSNPNTNLDIVEVTVYNLGLGQQIMHTIQYPPKNIGNNEAFHISMNFNTICENTGQRCCYIGYKTQGIEECDPEFNVFCGQECSEKNLDVNDLGSCDCIPNEYD